MDTGIGVDSAGRYITIEPSEAEFYYRKDGRKNSEVFDKEIRATVHDTKDSKTGFHFYWVHIAEPVPDKVTVYYSKIQDSYEEGDYLFLAEYDEKSDYYNSEYGMLSPIKTQNGFCYKIIAEWSKKKYYVTGYYGTAVYYVYFDN